MINLQMSEPSVFNSGTQIESVEQIYGIDKYGDFV